MEQTIWIMQRLMPGLVKLLLLLDSTTLLRYRLSLAVFHILLLRLLSWPLVPYLVQIHLVAVHRFAFSLGLIINLRHARASASS